jgi:AbrB family looped-hinge helix DNA binding protein
MSKVTSKRQVTIPKEVADRYRIEPGDEIEWIPVGDEIRVITAGTARVGSLDVPDRLAAFDRATVRRDERAAGASTKPTEQNALRGWTREELHDRGRTR